MLKWKKDWKKTAISTLSNNRRAEVSSFELQVWKSGQKHKGLKKTNKH